MVSIIIIIEILIVFGWLLVIIIIEIDQMVSLVPDASNQSSIAEHIR